MTVTDTKNNDDDYDDEDRRVDDDTNDNDDNEDNDDHGGGNYDASVLMMLMLVRGGSVVIVLDCQSRGSGFKSRPGQKFGFSFLFHLRPLAQGFLNFSRSRPTCIYRGRP